MDNNKLRPELQNIIDQFLNLTIDHDALKKSLIVREEINNLLVMASNKAQEQLDKLIPQVEQFAEHTKKKIREQRITICKLEDEIEIIQCEKSLVEEKHREEIINFTRTHEKQLETLKKNYEEEISQLKLIIESQKKSMKLMERARENSDFVHPAFQSSSKPPKKAKAKKSTAQAFNWPTLDVELTQENTDEDVGVKKKRKLYTPDNETVVDLNLDS